MSEVPQAVPSRMPGIVRLLYTHNPFYLISACLFVYGLKLLFRQGDASVLFQRGAVAYMEPWGLMTSLAAVTLLMAVTAILVVRIGRVWEDARSLILIVMLMFLAISVSFDELLTRVSDDHSLRHALWLFAVGTCLSLLVAEVMLRGMQIRLSWLYRFPLYVMLALFFAWPVLLLPQTLGTSTEQTRWLIAAFPAAIAVVTLLLMPAVRRGLSFVSSNGTPWSWPWFPWTPFLFLAAAVCFRAYSLTISFDVPATSGPFWDTAFGLYQLVPFLLAALVLLLEISVVESRPKLQRFMMLAAPLLLVLAYPWLAPWSSFGTYTVFAYTVTENIGSPVFLTLIGLVLFYAWGRWRGVAGAESGFLAMLLLSIWIGPDAFGYRTWSFDASQASAWPLVLLGIAMIVLSLNRRGSREALVGFVSLTFSATIAMHQSSLESWTVLLTIHLLLLSVLLTALLFHDELALALRPFGAVQLSVTLLIGVALLARRELPGLWIAGYGTTLTAFGFLAGWVMKERLYILLSLIHCAGYGLCGVAFGLYVFLLLRLPAGTKPVILAAVSFLAAVAISALKSGLGSRLRDHRLARQQTTP